MKSPYTLKEDIEEVLLAPGNNGYTEDIAEWVGNDIAQSLQRQLGTVSRPTGKLRISGLGTPCERKLWYSVNQPDEATPLAASTKNKFVFGDLTESHVLGLAKAAGHEVGGLQGYVDCLGIKGSRDCVIDGMLFDVKSASTNGFAKFKDNGLRRDDPFGYLSQLSSYLVGSLDDPLVRYKTHAGFIAFDKQFGHIEVDIYDLTPEIEAKAQEVQQKKDVVMMPEPPERPYEPVEDGKSGNMKIPKVCSYCDYKFHCWDNLRTFIYSGGPRYLTKVEREPNVWEKL